MHLFAIGSKHSVFIGNDCHTATVIYSNESIAIGGLTHTIESECEPYDYHFAMTKEQVEQFVPEIEKAEGYNSFVAIDLVSGRLLEQREWLRHNDALFVIGNRYHSPEEWEAEIGECITVYRKNGVAVVKIYNGDGCVYESFKKCGYNADEVRTAFTNFDDNYPVDCNGYFYLCVRESDDCWIDLHGNPLDDRIYDF